jgi:hypothetical protein
VCVLERIGDGAEVRDHLLLNPWCGRQLGGLPWTGPVTGPVRWAGERPVVRAAPSGLRTTHGGRR